MYRAIENYVRKVYNIMCFTLYKNFLDGERSTGFTNDFTAHGYNVIDAFPPLSFSFNSHTSLFPVDLSLTSPLKMGTDIILGLKR